MIKFNELRVDSKTNTLIVDVSTLKTLAPEVRITQIQVSTEEQINLNNPASTTAFIGKTTVNNLQDTRVTFDVTGNHIYFVLVTWTGTYPSTIDCGLDSNPDMGVVFDTCPIYNKIMSQIEQLANTCEIPTGFINYFLQFEAIKTAIETKHYQKAIDLYKEFINETPIVTSLTCRCHG